MATPIVLTGRDLILDDVVAVARDRRPVELAPAALERMRAARAAVERIQAEGVEVYGVTTGVGVRKRVRVSSAGHDRLLIRQHLIGQGAAVPADVARAVALRLANALARATTSARPALAERVVAALNEDRLPKIRALGSVGLADLAQLADLADGMFGEELEPGEAIALLNQNAYSTGWAALAFADALRLIDTLDVAAALDLVALGANASVLDAAIADTRRSAGLAATLRRLRSLLDGTVVEPRALQDPLVFRTVAQFHGAARDAFAFVRSVVEDELNAHQSNPLVTGDGRLLSTGCFDTTALATALDHARLVVAHVTGAAAERAVKLLQAPLTGLPEGLGAEPALAESALSELGIAVQALASEARLLAQPVSLELVSTTQAEGIEDRSTMAPLAARRLAEQVDLATRVVAVELQIALQAVDLRSTALGPRLATAHGAVRELVPFVGVGDALPDLAPLVTRVRRGFETP